MRGKLTQFPNPVQARARARRRRWQTRTVTLAGTAVLAGGLVAVSVPALAKPALPPPQASVTTTSIISVFPPAPLAGQQYTVQVSVSAGTNGTPGGTVVVSDGAAHACTATLTGGMGYCQLTDATGGAYTLTASYSGQHVGTAGLFLASTSAGTAVTVNAPPRFVADSPPPTAIAGFPYTYTFAASGYPAPAYALAPGAPSWLSINATTGVLSGKVPHRAHSFRYAVVATNGVGKGTTAGPFDVRVPRVPPARSAVSASRGRWGG